MLYVIAVCVRPWNPMSDRGFTRWINTMPAATMPATAHTRRSNHHRPNGRPGRRPAGHTLCASALLMARLSDETAPR
jgi:hypothetical protein